jgi:hypothetical protein
MANTVFHFLQNSDFFTCEEFSNEDKLASVCVSLGGP